MWFAMSLYLSTMTTLWTVEGELKVILQEKLNKKFLYAHLALVVEIRITKVNKYYPFPRIVCED